MLNKYGLFSREDDPQSISRSLAIPISRARSLIYDFQLRNTKVDDDWFKKGCRAVLAHARFYDANKIEFQVVSPLLRNEIAARLVSANAIVDSSFNSEIVRIRFNAFASLIKIVSTDEELRTIESTLRQIFKDEKVEKFTATQTILEKFLPLFLETVQKKGMDKFVDQAFSGLALLMPFFS